MKNKKRKIENLLLLIAGGIFIGCGIWLIMILLGYKEGTDEYQKIYKDMVVVADVSERLADSPNISGSGIAGADVSIADDATGQDSRLQIDFAALQEINADVVGWIDIPGLEISYPVVQTKDNQYYLDKTVQGKTNKAGSIYMDFRNSADMSDRNTIIHGHNMKNRTMFGNLKMYGEEGVAEANQEFYFYTPEKIYRCEVISYRTVDAVMEEYATGFATEDEYLAYLKRVLRSSWHDFGVEVGAEDRLITLSTCTASDTERFIVQAKLVEESTE